MRKLIALATLSAVAGVGAVVGLAGTASADTSTGIIKGNCGHLLHQPVRHLASGAQGSAPGTPVETLCARDGQALGRQRDLVHDREGRRPRLRPLDNDHRLDGHARRADARCAGGYSNSPRRIASATAAARSDTPSFSYSRWVWVFTVLTPMNSSAATCGIERPRANACSTCRSRSDSSGPGRLGPQPDLAGEAAGELGGHDTVRRGPPSSTASTISARRASFGR